MKDDKKGLMLKSLGSAELLDESLTTNMGTKVSLLVMLGLLFVFIYLVDKFHEFLLVFPLILILILLPILIVFFTHEIIEYKQVVFVRGLIMSSTLNRNTLATMLTLVKSSTTIYYSEQVTGSVIESDLAIVDNLVFKDNRVYYVIGYDSKTKTHKKLPIDKTSGKLDVKSDETLVTG